MLEEMLCDGYFGKATQFITSVIDANPNIIAENVRHMNVVVKEIGIWKDKLNEGKDNLLDNSKTTSPM